MCEQLEEVLEAFGEMLNGVVASLTNRNLFEVNDKEVQLNDKKREIFYSVTAMLLYVTKRVRPDLETLIFPFDTSIHE